jgi:hypothetical protein
MWSRAQRRPPSKAASPYGRGPVPAPHPALVPITSIKDRLRVLSARLLRQRDAVEQGLRDVEEMQKHVNLLYEDFQRPATWMPMADAAGDTDDVQPDED